MRSVILSQWRERRMGVIWQDLGAWERILTLQTVSAVQQHIVPSWLPAQLNHHAKFDAASFILGGEIRNRTNAHTHTHTQTNKQTSSDRYYPHIAYRHVWITSNNPITALNVRESSQFPRAIGNRGRGTQSWRPNFDRKWKYSRLVYMRSER